MEFLCMFGHYLLSNKMHVPHSADRCSSTCMIEVPPRIAIVFAVQNFISYVTELNQQLYSQVY